MSVLLNTAFAALAMVSLAAHGQTSIQVFEMYGNPSTPSIDKHDPHPERGMYVAFETNRPIEGSECSVSREPGSVNHKTIGARFFQRLTTRGTYMVVVEITSCPSQLGEPSNAGYLVSLAWSLAAPVRTAPAVRPNRNYSPEMFYIEPGDSGRFSLITPKKSESSVFVQNVDLMGGQPWTLRSIVNPVSVTNWAGPNLCQKFDASNLPGLINITSEYLDTYAQASLLNMDVEPWEWNPLPVNIQ